MKITGKSALDASAWESGELGRDEKFVKKASAAQTEALQNALGLQMISIRLQNQLIDDLKFIATAHGIGYQPLIRDVLLRFVTLEKKQIISDAIKRKKQEESAKEHGIDLRPQRKAA